MSTTNASATGRAVLVAVHLPGVDDAEFAASVAELDRLVRTLGHVPVGTVIQRRDNLSPAAVLGEGKVQELAELTGGSGKIGATIPRKKDKARLKRDGESDASSRDVSDTDQDADDEEDGDPKVALVAVDHDISPSQARNLERATGVPVLDRTGIIVEIFHRHAKSREAKLQVEIARLAYSAPRLRESPSGKERQQGRGAGEAGLELDRRKIRDRIAELKEELEHVQKDQDQRRAGRRDSRRVALVGYTNAGKSSLMRALTGSQVLVEDKLFATLDTTVRALVPEAGTVGKSPANRVLVSDTVGFIKKLPHDLVASFKSTLDEALEASLLLHVVDASDPTFRSQYAVTQEVLQEIGATQVPSRLVLNKADRLDDDAKAALLREYPEALLVSAHAPEGVAAVRIAILAFFEETYEERSYLVPYAEQGRVADFHATTRVVSEAYEEGGVRVTVRGDADTLNRLEKRSRAR